MAPKKEGRMGYAALHDAILAWYETNGRHDLPWRNTTDPYPIYLSEIMLQQTQVKTVLERFYVPFLETFPTLKCVAEAPQEAVLKQWQGLGYYTRARNLHAAARACGGKLPDSAEMLQKLPGLGQTTAHAVAAFAYHEAVPIMDANVKRILCRFFALASPTPKLLWEKAHDLLDRNDPYRYNQAMMDIGAAVCTPKVPDCEVCPLQSGCTGQTDPAAYPTPKKAKTIPHYKKTAFIPLHNGKIGLIRRKTRLLHGLWGFIQQEKLPETGRPVGEAKHTYSHFKLTLETWIVEETPECDGWFTPEEINALPLSKIDELVLALYRNQKLNLD
jgi:A/G-specific adenine glycosylase